MAMRETLRRNRLTFGLLYLQVTRGSAPRDHAIPAHARPTLIMTARRLDAKAIAARRANGVAVVTRPDIRWGRCDIKTTALTANVLAKTDARRAGALEAWLVDDKGFITEGASTNAWIVKDGTAATHPLDRHILPGVTRAGVLEVARSAGIAIEERAFTPAEAQVADEAFLTSATGGVLPVVTIDGRPVGTGKPGPVTLRLQALYQDRAEGKARP
jgi:D-alanine transaminase